MKMRVAGVAALLAIGAACSEAPQAKVPEKPPEPVTGRHALQQMYISARSWAQDLAVLNVTSMHLSGVPVVPGKAGGWTVTFYSPTLQQSRLYTFAAVEVSVSLHQGIGMERAEASRGNRAFPFAAIKIDSDDAYKVAVKHEAKYAAAHPDMTISYLLQMNDRFPDAVWRVIWGENAATSATSVLVDASTGEYMGTLH